MDSASTGFGCEMRLQTIIEYCKEVSKKIDVKKYRTTKFSKLLALIVLVIVPLKLFNYFKLQDMQKGDVKKLGIFWHSIYFSKYKLDYVDLVDSQFLHYRSALKHKFTLQNFFKMMILGILEKKLLKNYNCFFNGIHDRNYYTSEKYIYTVNTPICLPNTKLWLSEVVDVSFDERTHLQNKLIFGNLADFSYANNVSSLRGLLKLSSSIGHPHEIVLAGRESVNVAQKMKNPNIKALGFLEDTCDFYRSIDVVVIPMEFGTGIPNKYLEALINPKYILCSDYIFDCIPSVNREHGVFRYTEVQELFKDLTQSKVSLYSRIHEKRLDLLRGLNDESIRDFLRVM